MKKAIWFLVAGVALSLAATSCKKDLYDKEETERVLELTFHNDTVDANHTWTLMESYTVHVTANVPGVSRVELLSANPYVSTETEVLSSASASEGEHVFMKASVPSVCDSIYVAAVDEKGDYTIVATKAANSTVDFSQLNTTNSGTLTTPNRQEVFYCFCNSFPQPSTTWSFNDVVLSISKEALSDRKLRLTVTLQALGTTAQTAAAVRLANVMFDEVESVEVVGSTGFVKNQELSRTIIKDDATLLRGQDNTAVINLFDDGHAAFNSNIGATGEVTHVKYNVKHGNSSDNRERNPVTVRYDITFKGNLAVNDLSYAEIDPFILYYYNSNVWEVHKYPYKLQQTLVDYLGSDPTAYNTGFTWALEIPYGWFRYPLDGNSMGSYKNGALYGAYQVSGHSFGQWGAHQEQSRDWYLYPNTYMVY